MAKTNKPVSDSDTDNGTTAPTEATASTLPTKPRYEGITSFVYAGPSLPGGQLKSYAVLNGTYEEIAEYYKDAIAEYPRVARLIVPATRFAETRDKTRTSGNVLYNWYQEISAAIKVKGVE
jgi:hypothetical protein